jgi:hypothetical protein
MNAEPTDDEVEKLARKLWGPDGEIDNSYRHKARALLLLCPPDGAITPKGGTYTLDLPSSKETGRAAHADE